MSASSDTTAPSVPSGSLASKAIVQALAKLDLTGKVTREGKRPLASGGFADVWKGNRVDTKGQTIVAIKVMKSFSRRSGVLPYERILAHLYREIYKWRDLDHRNILKLQGFAIEKDGGWVGLVADWLPNGDAMSYLRDNPDADREALILDAAKGLTYLHTLPTALVHGDMKGENILINELGAGCIGDFGLADFTDLTCRKTGFTTSTLVQGSLRWASPELLNDDDPVRTLASDVWAFACTALEVRRCLLIDFRIT
ncbi:hypothetical protein FRC03_004683 [Tulasnella sp. 419]|nr:hypothetical protein FRC03_004683 [Tulasnella sp. 419]